MKKLILNIVILVIFGAGSVLGQDANEKREGETAVSQKVSKFTHLKRRNDTPFQIQLSQTFSSANPYSGAPGTAVHLGFQLNPRIYLGWTSSFFFGNRNLQDEAFSYKYDRDESGCFTSDEDSKPFGQEDAVVTTSKLDPIHFAEVRVTPWDFGLYFSFGLMQRGYQRSTTEFASQSREVGENTYLTSLEATLEYERWYGGAMGMGFNYIFESGLVLGTNIVTGLGRQTPKVSVQSSAAISKADLDFWKRQIENNEKQVPFQIGLSIGYAM